MAHFRRPWLLLAALLPLALWGLHWGISLAFVDGADLERRVEEVRLFQARVDPYCDPDLTYPPSALPVFTAALGPLDDATLPGVWVGTNLLALAGLAWGLIQVFGRDWPAWLQVALALVLVASRPVRAGLALGQFHLIPTALLVGAWAITRPRQPGDRSWFARSAWPDVVAGLCLGLAAIKPTMVLPFFGGWLLSRGPRALVVAAAVQGALWGGASAWLGVAPQHLAREWLANARTQEAAGTLDIPSLLAQTGLAGQIPGTAVTLAVLLAGFALMALLPRDDQAGFAALGLLLCALFAYHRHYDLVLLLPALAWLVDRAHRRWQRGESGRLANLAAVAFAALLILPSHPAPLRRFSASYEAIFVLGTYAVLAGLIVGLSRRSAPVPRKNENPEVASATLGVGR